MHRSGLPHLHGLSTLYVHKLRGAPTNAGTNKSAVGKIWLQTFVCTTSLQRKSQRCTSQTSCIAGKNKLGLRTRGRTTEPFGALRAQSHAKIRKESHPPFWSPGGHKARKESKMSQNDPVLTLVLTLFDFMAARGQKARKDSFLIFA